LTHRSCQLSAASVVTAAEGSIAAKAGDDVLVLSLSSGQYYRLAGTATHIWSLMRAPIRISDIREALTRTYEVPADACERDILILIEALMERGLAEVCLEETPTSV
jgi:hypothetical protein